MDSRKKEAFPYVNCLKDATSLKCPAEEARYVIFGGFNDQVGQVLTSYSIRHSVPKAPCCS